MMIRLENRRSPVRLLALTMVIALPVLGLSGPASAKSASKCSAHPNRPSCRKGGGGSGTGGGASSIYMTASPNPLVETGQSEIYAVIRIETSPSYAGDDLLLSSSQLEDTCTGGFGFGSIATGTLNSGSSIKIALDDDGNATAVVAGQDCAPGSSVIEADLTTAPYLTALTTLVANPPVVTPEGITPSPSPEVETGDTSASGFSDVYAVFFVETNPVYAEQPVEISSAQLEGRCGEGWSWFAGNGGTPASGTSVNQGAPAQTTLDDDGNAVFVFAGASCAAGDSEVIADVLAGTHPTYTTTYTISPPVPNPTI